MSAIDLELVVALTECVMLSACNDVLYTKWPTALYFGYTCNLCATVAVYVQELETRRVVKNVFTHFIVY